MYDLKVYPNFTLIGIRDKIVFFTPQGTQQHELVLPLSENPPKDGAQSNNPPQVVKLDYCSVLKLMAVSASDKTLRCFKVEENEGKITTVPVGKCLATSRTISCMKFAPKHGLLFGCDKSDCFEYNMLAEPEKRSKWVLGHMSLILDIDISPDERYIVTCDRDEKIKVTSYPDCHNIVCYCLGHREYVVALAFLAPEKLLSVAGDKTLRVWQFVEGKEIVTHRVQNPAIDVTVQRAKLGDHDGTLCAVTSYGADEIEVLHVADDPSNKCTSCETLSIDASFTILNAVLSSSLELYLLVWRKDDKIVELMVYEFMNQERQFRLNVDHALRKNFQKHFQSVTIYQPRDYSTLFKNSIDNLSDYYERKKQKIGKKTVE
ncbi:tRNA (guanine-N(7)-)-methyltransferase non-catalytic subunit wuho [Anopheles bellator]|uniref:tRNA (guanine-N(7)-)-methyltransferase non-catalytic subunit wuho n=1 Tax=Anopheles bellator TaxID=139047 RepID=UPI002648ECA4|nr:tRNA (guanine-N(7)-)-methyltransferase non-catalytic subunit wuho [Anopheles bellator]